MIKDSMSDIQIDIKSMATLFMDQCVGEYGGHMGTIPNNPLLQSIFRSCGYFPPNETNAQFARILRGLATAVIDKEMA